VWVAECLILKVKTVSGLPTSQHSTIMRSLGWMLQRWSEGPSRVGSTTITACNLWLEALTSRARCYGRHDSWRDRIVYSAVRSDIEFEAWLTYAFCPICHNFELLSFKLSVTTNGSLSLLFSPLPVTSCGRFPSRSRFSTPLQVSSLCKPGLRILQSNTPLPLPVSPSNSHVCCSPVTKPLRLDGVS